MRRIRIQAGWPEQRDGDFGQRDGQREGDEVCAQGAGVAFGHAGDQIRGAGKRQGFGEAADGCGDVALEPPKARAVPRRLGYDPQQDHDWLREHRPDYAGCWVAVHRGRLLAADPDLGRVMELANAEVGPANALITRAPERRPEE